MIILFGAAGSGKSVQGKSLADKYGWKWMSVGQLLRDKQSPELEAKMHGGDLVDDRLVVNMMHDGMMEAHYAGQNVILDGYPRDVWRAEWIADHDDTQYIDGAIILDVKLDICFLPTHQPPFPIKSFDIVSIILSSFLMYPSDKSSNCDKNRLYSFLLYVALPVSANFSFNSSILDFFNSCFLPFISFFPLCF